MASKHGTEFRREAVRLALTSGLTRKQVAADLGIGFSTLCKWVQQDRDKDLMTGPHEDQEKEIIRLRVYSLPSHADVKLPVVQSGCSYYASSI